MKYTKNSVMACSIFLLILADTALCSDVPNIDFDGVIAHSKNTSIREGLEKNGIIIPTSRGMTVQADAAIQKGTYLPGDPMIVQAWCENASQPFNVTATFTVTPKGHSHFDTPPAVVPAEPFTQVNIPANGKAVWNYNAPVFASDLTIVLAFSGGCSQPKTLQDSFQIQGLVSMASVAGKYDVSCMSHTNCNYVIPEVKAKLEAIANAYYLNYKPRNSLHYRDMSLQYGGLFDKWMDWKEPHHGHRTGLHADVSMRDVPDAYQKGLLLLFQTNGARVLEQHDGIAPDKNYWHLDFSTPKDKGYSEELRCNKPEYYKDMPEYVDTQSSTDTYMH